MPFLPHACPEASSTPHSLGNALSRQADHLPLLAEDMARALPEDFQLPQTNLLIAQGHLHIRTCPALLSATATFTSMNIPLFLFTPAFADPYINETTMEKHTYPIACLVSSRPTAADTSCLAMLQQSQIKMLHTWEQYYFQRWS